MKDSIKYIFTLAILFSNSGLFAKDFTQQLVNSSSTQAHAIYGWEICVSEDWAFIASPKHDINNYPNAGKVDIYKHTGSKWELFQTLNSPYLQAHENFGHAITSESDHLIIGAIANHSSGPFSGCAYYYQYNGSQWAFSQQLLPHRNEHGAMYGQDVSVENNTLAIGAPKATQKKSGAVYLYSFKDNKWNKKAIIADTDASMNELLGWRVLVKTNLYTTALRAEVNSTLSGKVKVYNISTDPELIKTITPSQPEDHLCYGDGLSASQDFLVIGAHKGSKNGISNGYVTIYKTDNFSLVQTIESPQSKKHAFFGKHIVLKNKLLFIGECKGSNETTTANGFLYDYELKDNTFEYKSTIQAENASDHSHFAWSFDANDKGILIGEKGSDNNGTDAGEAHFFSLSSSNIDPISVATDDVVLSPNPWAEELKITSYLVQESDVEIIINDIEGRVVKQELKKDCPAGKFEYLWSLSDNERALIKPGAYFVKIKINNNITLSKTLNIGQ